MKKLSILHQIYGTEKKSVIILNYNDGREKTNYYIDNDTINTELIDKIREALKEGYMLEYKDRPIVCDLK